MSFFNPIAARAAQLRDLESQISASQLKVHDLGNDIQELVAQQHVATAHLAQLRAEVRNLSVRVWELVEQKQIETERLYNLGVEARAAEADVRDLKCDVQRLAGERQVKTRHLDKLKLNVHTYEAALHSLNDDRQRLLEQQAELERRNAELREQQNVLQDNLRELQSGKMAQKAKSLQEDEAALTTSVMHLHETLQALQLNIRKTFVDFPLRHHPALQAVLPDPHAISSQAISEAELASAIQDVLGTIPERDRQVLTLRFGLDDAFPMTLEEVGQQLGISDARVWAIEQHAFRLLRHPLRSRKLREFLTADEE